MFRVSYLAVLLGVAGAVLASQGASAQELDESGVVYEAARNKIGLMRYCRNNALLDPNTANKAAALVRANLDKPPPADAPDAPEGTRGDAAEEAGEEGYWEIGRRRHITAVATLFRTTAAGLCREWAEETLRPIQLAPSDQGLQVTSVPNTVPTQAYLPNAFPRPSVVRRQAGVVRRAHRSGRGPASAKAGAPATKPQAAPVQRWSSGGSISSVPFRFTWWAQSAKPAPAGQTPAAARRDPRLNDRSSPLSDKWPINRLERP